jgi:hypothetical protein
MSRVYFQRAVSGYRAVRGEVIRRVQIVLKAAGSDPEELDGIYGNDTETALKDFQRKQNLQANGKITDETWMKLMGAQSPAILDRCLQLTADFEGHGFQKLVGNFDGAGLTWGIIGFTLQHSELQKILTEVQQNHPALLAQAFGNLKDELLSMLRQSRSEQLDWADSISIGSRKYRVEQSWEQAFAALGASPEVQAIQLQRVNKYWDIALRDVGRFALETEMGIALCFDIAVQNGGIDFATEERRIKRWGDDNPGASERDRCIRIADVVAENSRPQYVEDVRQRKRTVATGEGQVHGARYATRDWGIAEDPWRS